MIVILVVELGVVIVSLMYLGYFFLVTCAYSISNSAVQLSEALCRVYIHVYSLEVCMGIII